MTDHALPIIDLAPATTAPLLADPGEWGFAQRDLAATLVEVYHRHGFGYVVGHGIDPTLRDRVFAVSAEFHAQSAAAKASIALDARHRGYIAPDVSTDRTSTVEEVEHPNHSESFMMMREDGPDDDDVRSGAYLAGPNQWPDGLPGFRSTLEAYHAAASELADTVIRLFEYGLGIDAGRLSSAFARPTTWLRLLHYPPVADDAPARLFGSAPHRDFGGLTFLSQDDIGGLQVRSVDGAWLDVPPIAGALVVNVGDMLHRYSNGWLLSTPHRVDNRTGRERYSVPFFYDPHVSSIVAPDPACVNADRPAAFEPILFADHLHHELTGSYERHRVESDPEGAEGV